MEDLISPERARLREAARPRISQPERVPRPLPQGIPEHGRRYTEGERAQALTLMSLNMTPKQVADYLRLNERTMRRWWTIAMERGWNPYSPDPDERRLLSSFISDGKATGRPQEVTKQEEEVILNLVQADRAGREKSNEVLGYEVGQSYITVCRVL